MEFLESPELSPVEPETLAGGAPEDVGIRGEERVYESGENSGALRALEGLIRDRGGKTERFNIDRVKGVYGAIARLIQLPPIEPDPPAGQTLIKDKGPPQGGAGLR